MTKFSHHEIPETSIADMVRQAQLDTSTRTDDLLLELFDNAIDAGATQIRSGIHGSSKRATNGEFWIQDNGIGVATIAELLRMGGSRKGGGHESIGRHGVGAKDCLWKVGGLPSTLSVESRTRRGAWRTSIDWKSQHSRLFRQEDCPHDDVELFDKTGLRIFMQQCYRRMPGITDFRRRVALAYWSWLEQTSRSITINGESLAPPRAPDFDARFDPEEEVRVDADRWLTIEGGVLAGDSDLSGITIMQGNRTIYARSGLGAGSYGTSGVFVRVRLYGAWTLGRNKQQLSEDHELELKEVLERMLSELMEEASERARLLNVGNLLDRANEMFAAMQGVNVGVPRRPGKSETKQKPPVQRNSGRKVREANIVSGEGAAKERRRKHRAQPFALVTDIGEASVVGIVDMPGRRVVLHKNNPAVEFLLQEDDDRSLAIIGASILAEHLHRTDARLPWADTYGEMLACVLCRGVPA